MKMLDLLQAMVRGEAPPPPIAQLLGMRLVSIVPGETVMTLQARPEHANPMGTLHGGVLCDLADACMGMAYASTLDEGESFTTLELKINYLRPVWSGDLRAEAGVVNRGRTIGLVQCDIFDAQARLVARATSTCLALRGPITRAPRGDGTENPRPPAST